MLRLTPEQRDAAFAHCQDISLDEGVRWIKESCHVLIGKSALGEWLREQRIERSMAAELAALRDNQQGASLVNDAASGATPLTVANSVLFANAIFAEFRKPDGKRDENRLIRYMGLALKARELEIRERAGQLSIMRFRHGIGKETAKREEDPVDEQAKIDKVMLTLFGPEPLGFQNPDGTLENLYGIPINPDGTPIVEKVAKAPQTDCPTAGHENAGDSGRAESPKPE